MTYLYNACPDKSEHCADGCTAVNLFCRVVYKVYSDANRTEWEREREREREREERERGRGGGGVAEKAKLAFTGNEKW